MDNGTGTGNGGILQLPSSKTLGIDSSKFPENVPFGIEILISVVAVAGFGMIMKNLRGS